MCVCVLSSLLLSLGCPGGKVRSEYLASETSESGAKFVINSRYLCELPPLSSDGSAQSGSPRHKASPRPPSDKDRRGPTDVTGASGSGGDPGEGGWVPEVLSTDRGRDWEEQGGGLVFGGGRDPGSALVGAGARAVGGLHGATAAAAGAGAGVEIGVLGSSILRGGGAGGAGAGLAPRSGSVKDFEVGLVALPSSARLTVRRPEETPVRACASVCLRTPSACCWYCAGSRHPLAQRPVAPQRCRAAPPRPPTLTACGAGGWSECPHRVPRQHRPGTLALLTYCLV